MKEIKKIKNGLLSRQFSMAKLALKTGAGILLSGDSDLKGKLKQGLEKHLDDVVSELGIMKGSLMKAGQMLSMYSGAFLSPEAQKILKSLENQTSFLEWNVIKKRIPKEWMDELEINSAPLAAASLGQVHLATPRSGGKSFVMKVQYAGVKKAIDNDVRALKWILTGLSVLPKDLNFNEIFDEIREMLHQETDYTIENQTTKDFAKLVKNYPQYQIPSVVDKYSTDTILSTTFLDGVSPRSPEIKALTQEMRNDLGREFMRLLFLEIFVWGVVQTDAHVGNYLILNHLTKPQWGLLDFGATKRPPKEFLLDYQNLVLSCALLDRELYFKTVNHMGYLSKNRESNTELLWEYANLLGEPFKGGVYDWGNSPIPDQVFKFMPRLFKEISVGNPPTHAIFIDRKIGGVFFMLKELGAKFDARKLLEEYTTHAK